MRGIYTLLVATLLSLPACKTYQVSTQPVEVLAPDSLPDPLPTNGWEFSRTSPTSGVFLPPQAVAGKVKNSHNTDSYNKKSNNTEMKQKNSRNTKAKGEAIVGDANAPIQAKKQAVVGDGNTVEQEEEGLPGWVWLPVVLLLLLLYWVGKRLMLF